MIKLLLNQFWDTKQVFGFRVAFARTRGYIALRYFGVKNYQEPLTKVIKQLSKNNKVFIDIGAASGDIVEVVSPYYTKTVAVEPAPHHIMELKLKIKSNNLKKVILVKHAMGEKNGFAQLGMSSTNPDDNSLFLRDDLTEYIKVKKETVDELVERLKLRGGIVIKIDVQGFEEFVLKGAKKTLSGGCIIIMEFWPWGLGQVGTDAHKLIDFINSYGYEVFDLKGGRYSKNQISQIILLGSNNKRIVDDIVLKKPTESSKLKP